MTRWEYRELLRPKPGKYHHDYSPQRKADEKRVELGRDGWECYALIDEDYGTTFYFKRPLIVAEIVKR